MRTVVVAPFLLTFLLTGALSIAEPLRIEWEPVPDAFFYEGTVIRGQQVYRVRTKETWLLVDPGAECKMEARAASGYSLGPVTLRSQGAPLPEPSAAKEQDEDQPALADEPPVLPKDPPKAPVDSPPQDPAREAVDQESTEAPPSETEEEKSKQEEATEPVEPQSSQLWAGARFGNERVVAEGGTSDFDGEAGFGGVIVGLAWRISPSIGLFGLGSIHSFQTTTIEESSSGETETINAFQRSLVMYNLRYYFGQLRKKSGSVQLGIGSGITINSSPLLEVQNDSTGEADLRTQHAIGLNFEAVADVRVWRKNVASIAVRSAPLWFTPVGGGWFMIDLGWRYQFSTSGPWGLGLNLHQEAASFAMEVTCDRDAAGCEETSTTESTISSGSLSLHYLY